MQYRYKDLSDFQMLDSADRAFILPAAATTAGSGAAAPAAAAAAQCQHIQQ